MTTSTQCKQNYLERSFNRRACEMCHRKLKYFVILCWFLVEIPHVAHTGSEDRVRGSFETTSCSKNQYFDTNAFECKKCWNDLVSSDDGLECVCDRNSRVVAIKKGNPVCNTCEAGKIRTSDGYECISCNKDGAACGCSGNQIQIERSLNGTILDILQCLPCPKNTYSSSDHSQCLPCVPALATSRRDDRDNFFLDDASHGNMAKYCMPQNAPKEWPDIRSTYLNKFKEITVDSYYFRTELRFTTYSCENGDRKACAHLANMCALTLFTESQPCKPFTRKTYDNPIKLFYRDGDARTILNARTIEQRYSLDQKDPNNKLKLIVAAFRLRGDLETISEPSLPCSFFSSLPFGVNLRKKCKISANELLNGKMLFFAPYLEYFEKSNANKKLLHPLPVLIKDHEYTSEDEDVTKWKLSSRFFSVDKITGYKAIANVHNASFARAPELQALRYVKSLSLAVKLQERNERGKIFPPLLIVEYDELTYEKIIENYEVSVEYKVSYTLPDDETGSAIEVCIGIFTGLAVAFSAIKAWSYSRRSYENIPNVATISWFIVYCLAAVGNILLLICSCACLYIFLFYKGQKVVHILLPNETNEWTIKVCTIVAFAFKTVEILSLIYQQRRINIFFIDWEQPRRNDTSSLPLKFDSPHTSLRKSYSTGRFHSDGRNTMQSASEIIGARRNKTPSKSSQASTPSRQSIGSKIIDRIEPPDIPTAAGISSETNFSIGEHDLTNNYSVSIWRTCIVANEWLKMKTKRKINILFQIIVTLFILEIMGGKYWSTAIPELTLEQDKMLAIDESFTLEYAVGILVYLIVYSVQWWFSVFIYERYIKNRLQEFVDLCSMANISVFILSHDFYGYYIHGRSVHGFADTDLLTLINDLKREENNLCAHRGLIPGTTEQTFVISVSKTFRTFYDRLLGAENLSDGKFLRNVSNIPDDWNERWKTHLRLRNFLTSFLDHCFKNVDYTVKERHFFEKMCDLEMADVDDKSVFYIDTGYSFERTLFYGNEWTLATFEINVFLLVLVLGGNYILASVATLIVAKAVNTVARFNGKRQLATKTFLDERFLVS